MSADPSKARTVLYIISKAPYSNANGQEAIDAILVGASFDLDVSVLFIHDGVFQLKQGQDSSNSALRQFTKTYGALEDFGVDNVYVHDLSMQARGVVESELMRQAKVVDSNELREIITSNSKVFTF